MKTRIESFEIKWFLKLKMGKFLKIDAKYNTYDFLKLEI